MWTSSKICDTEQFFILLSVLCYLCKGLCCDRFTTLFSVYGCFACICISVPYACLLTYQTRRGCWIPWSWNSRCLSYRTWNLKSGLGEEQEMFLNIEKSLSSPHISNFNCSNSIYSSFSDTLLCRLYFLLLIVSSVVQNISSFTRLFIQFYNCCICFRDHFQEIIIYTNSKKSLFLLDILWIQILWLSFHLFLVQFCLRYILTVYFYYFSCGHAVFLTLFLKSTFLHRVFSITIQNIR